MTATSEIGIIIVDHGSRRTESNDTLLAATRRFSEVTDWPIIEPAHMELAQPDLSSAYESCVRQGAKHVIVFPYFLSPGRHWDQDIPALVAEAAQGHSHTTWQVTKPFGVHDSLLDVISQRIREAT